VFRAKQLLIVLDRFGVVKHEIARRQAWQNYIEANYGIQRRLADWGFARAGNWPELLAVHDHWVTEHHFQDRPADRRSPAVLHRVCGKLFDPEELHRIFYSTHFSRVLDRAGYARFRRWRVYAEHLTLVDQDEPMAQYRLTYQPAQRRLKTVTPEQLFETAHCSPQLPLWTRGDDEWLPVLRLPAYTPRRPRPTGAVQPPLFLLDEVGPNPSRERPSRLALSRLTAHMC
jgi:hypothetical protein